MAEDGWVDIVHPETGMTSTVHTSSVPAWETAGWTRADNGSGESGQQEASGETTAVVSPVPPGPGIFDQTPGGAPSDADEE